MTGGRAARAGGIERALAGLLALALLVLAGLSPTVAARAAPVEPHGHRAAPHHLAPGHGPHGVDAVPTRHGRDHPAGGHRDHDAGPALACCVAMHCPMMTGGLPAASAQPPQPVAQVPCALAVVPRLAGLSIPPALPPPRVAA